MMHSHDIYEERARALRHQELRALVRALASLFRSPFKRRQAVRKNPFAGLDPVNDRNRTLERAA